MDVVVNHVAVLSHAYLSVSCGCLALLLNLEWMLDCRWLIKGIRHRCNRFAAAVIRCGVESDTFHLSVTLYSVCSWSMSVSYRYQLRKKNQCISIGWKWRTRSNTINSHRLDKIHIRCYLLHSTSSTTLYTTRDKLRIYNEWMNNMNDDIRINIPQANPSAETSYLT